MGMGAAVPPKVFPTAKGVPPNESIPAAAQRCGASQIGCRFQPRPTRLFHFRASFTSFSRPLVLSALVAVPPLPAALLNPFQRPLTLFQAEGSGGGHGVPVPRSRAGTTGMGKPVGSPKPL